jgi:hypothetical protein
LRRETGVDFTANRWCGAEKEECEVNKFLARAVGFLNGALAIILVVAGALFGGATGQAFGFVFGLTIGFVVALVACGLLALVIDMHNELIKIRMALERTAVVRTLV